MKLSQISRTALILTTMLIFSSGLDMRGFAEANSPQGTKNIVLVHGAWADGSCWSKVIALLQAKGFHVFAVQNPLTSLADDVAATKRIIALQDGPVILVGHSYAGVVITEAGNDPKVVGLVYVAAFAPGEGESINSISKPYPPAPRGSELRPDAQGFSRRLQKGLPKTWRRISRPVSSGYSRRRRVRRRHLFSEPQLRRLLGRSSLRGP
jgi:pimeloyl-ACP methyl ester carboxylesterase